MPLRRIFLLTAILALCIARPAWAQDDLNEQLEKMVKAAARKASPSIVQISSWVDASRPLFKTAALPRFSLKSSSRTDTFGGKLSSAWACRILAAVSSLEPSFRTSASTGPL